MSTRLLLTAALALAPTSVALAGDYGQGVQFGTERNSVQRHFDAVQLKRSVNRSARIVTRSYDLSAIGVRVKPQSHAAAVAAGAEPRAASVRTGPNPYGHGSETGLFVRNPVHIKDWRDLENYWNTLPGLTREADLSSDPTVRARQVKANAKAMGCTFWYQGPCIASRRIGKIVQRPYPEGGTKFTKITMLKRPDGSLMSLGPKATVCETNIFVVGQCDNRRPVGTPAPRG